MLAKRIHLSWFVCALSVGIICGTALCLLATSILFANAQWFLIAASLLFIASVRHLRILLVAAFAAGLLVGFTRGQLALQNFAAYQLYYGQEVSMQGTVVEDVSYGKSSDQRVRIGDVNIDGKNLGGEVWISSADPVDIKRGDRVHLSGTLLQGFGNMQATMFRADIQAVSRPHPGDIGRQFRDWFAAGIARAIPDPQVSLGTGYLLGQKNALPETLQNEIRITGLTHVVVASGYNLVILVVFARKVFRRVSKYLAALAGGTMIVGFMMITGLSPSMTRASLVAGLGLLAWYYGRKIHPVLLLSFSAAVTLLLRPAYIWGDVGWFLSFASFAGILLLAPLLQSYFWGKDSKPGVMRELFIATLSAQIMTLPLTMFIFQQYSPYALLANLLVLPIVPFAMLFTFIAGLGSLLIPGLAAIFGFPATVLLSYSTFIIGKLASLPGALGEIKLSSDLIITSYVLGLAAIIYLWRKTNHNFRFEKNSSEIV